MYNYLIKVRIDREIEVTTFDLSMNCELCEQTIKDITNAEMRKMGYSSWEYIGYEEST